MLGINAITPRKLINIVPEEFRNMPYRKLREGETVTITKVIFSVYPATKKNPDGERVPIVRKDGTPVLNESMYLGMSDGCYTSIRGDTAFMQLSQTVGFNETEPGIFSFDMNEKVRIVLVDEKMGSETYQRYAFDPTN